MSPIPVVRDDDVAGVAGYADSFMVTLPGITRFRVILDILAELLEIGPGSLSPPVSRTILGVALSHEDIICNPL